MRLFVNVLGFQTAWWACIAGVGHGFELAALALCVALASLHVLFAHQPRQEIQLAAIALIVGVAVDSALQGLSVTQFYGWALGPLSPFWLWLLWVLFAMTLNASLGFLQSKSLWLSAWLGAVFGPLTYFAGAQWGAASLQSRALNLGLIAVMWSLALPLLVYTAQHLFKPPQGLT